MNGSTRTRASSRHVPSNVAPAVDYILQAGEAIAEAHTLGIIHRDLKPANLFFARRADGTPWIKVLDFGISKAPRHLAGDRETRLTGDAAVMGSPQYMSPEQRERAVRLRGVPPRRRGRHTRPRAAHSVSAPRTPDPTLQLLRSTVLERVRGGAPQGTQFVDPASLFAVAPEPPLVPLREQVARANRATIHRAGVGEVKRCLDDIQRDRDAAYALLART